MARPPAPRGRSGDAARVRRDPPGLNKPRHELVYGRQPVREALRARRRKVHALYLAQGMQTTDVLQESMRLAEEAGAAVESVERARLDTWLDGANHQGVALAVDPYPYASVDSALALARRRQQDPLLLLLDRVQDPQNLGTLLRTADACGVHGVVIPRHRSAGVTPAVVSASAGAVEHLLVCEETNLVATLKHLKAEGLWIAGLEAHPSAQPYDSVDLRGPLGIVVGSEGFGLGRLVTETCDWLLKLPMAGHIDSLNAAVAGSVLLFHVMRLRAAALQGEA